MATSRRLPRTCRRPDCARSASATMSLSYVEASVRIDALHDEAHPARWDLCGEHADQLSVPRGWTRDDQRRGLPADERVDDGEDRRAPPAEPPERRQAVGRAPLSRPAPEPGRAEQPAAAARAVAQPADRPPPQGKADEDRPAAPSQPATQPSSSPRRSNRYAALLACLPQIAASLAVGAERPADPQQALLPDIPGQLRLPVSDRRTAADRTGPNGATGPDGRSAPASAGAPDNVVPLVRRSTAGVLDPIG